ncbi:CRP/FNR family transcriptional regulator, anaerobic regulatory protein [Thermoanaerobacter thermohydrosulfuricus]|uniref:Crp/Fnr family transcriptional regulator n=3 Tax=Thermoanaerobacteraceae TaxID=186814 RepID=M8CRA8_THETY|nr:Crp/Fnr family transcriptional regulator [Thermoanaerobacter thermohydrosulfuricus WC1]SDG51489.1 CRP/FNR family transcriptional regulator, anaerobic regulatory protein [Thermoanaerobacter thermohydrosulfuricus]SFE05841.1 CRP/FNR family transcriptional regulator, anaerobic regulatory protein [Thermoanaerobacter thermohydrosulfuricus]
MKVIMADFDYLKKVPYFNELEDKSLEEIHKISTINFFKKGSIIFMEGEKGEAIYFVKSGKVKISKTSSIGKEYIIKIMEKGDVFAESILFVGGEYPATAEAIEDSEVIMLKNKDIENLILKNTEIALSIIKLMAKRLKNVSYIIENLALRDSIGRTASVLLTFAKERGVNVKEGILLNLNLNRQDLANIIGISRETVTRVLSQMDKEGIIKLNRNKVIIKDIERLREML